MKYCQSHNRFELFSKLQSYWWHLLYGKWDKRTNHLCSMRDWVLVTPSHHLWSQYILDTGCSFPCLWRGGWTNKSLPVEREEAGPAWGDHGKGGRHNNSWRKINNHRLNTTTIVRRRGLVCLSTTTICVCNCLWVWGGFWPKHADLQRRVEFVILLKI